jgi:hypothetical protein
VSDIPRVLHDLSDDEVLNFAAAMSPSDRLNLIAALHCSAGPYGKSCADLLLRAHLAEHGAALRRPTIN